MITTLSIAECKELGILKWKYLAKTGKCDIDEDCPDIDKLDDLPSFCAFCQRSKDLYGPGECGKCPLFHDDGCCNGIHPKWAEADTVEERKKYAKQILKVIKNIPA